MGDENSGAGDDAVSEDDGEQYVGPFGQLRMMFRDRPQNTVASTSTDPVLMDEANLDAEVMEIEKELGDVID